MNSFAEKFDCGIVNDDPEYYAEHPNGKKSWDSEEDIGFETISLNVDGKNTTRCCPLTPFWIWI